MADILIGTSGWHYKEWVGPLYKDDKEVKLTSYSRVFGTVEIDSTFYRYPDKYMVMRWTKLTMPAFVFAAKLPQLLTHEKELDLGQGVEGDLQRFCDLMQPMREHNKLGCILIQLPPSFRADRIDRLESFFEILPSEFSFAVEFRDLSWMKSETWTLLRKHNVAYTIVDEPLLPPEAIVTSNIAYFRWHGRGRRPWYNYRYTEEELKPWVPKVKEIGGKVERVFGYFNNHFHGYAVENGLDVLEMLGVMTPLQSKARSAVKSYLERPARGESVKLDSFLTSKPLGTADLLLTFMDPEKLKRAEQIEDSSVVIKNISNTRIEASVREYEVTIDPENKRIRHDCADWNKVRTEKNLCKHLGKLMLTLPKERAVELLRKIDSERMDWRFETVKANG